MEQNCYRKRPKNINGYGGWEMKKEIKITVRNLEYLLKAREIKEMILENPSLNLSPIEVDKVARFIVYNNEEISEILESQIYIEAN